jgi:hypothetical protein
MEVGPQNLLLATGYRYMVSFTRRPEDRTSLLSGKEAGRALKSV